MKRSSIFLTSILIIFFSMMLNYIPYQTYKLTQQAPLSEYKGISIFVLGMLGVLSIVNIKSLTIIDEFWNDLLSGFFDINVNDGTTIFEISDLKIFICGVVIGSLLLISLIVGIVSSFSWIFVALLKKRYVTMVFMIISFICFMGLIISFNLSEFNLMKKINLLFKEASIIFSFATAGGVFMFLSACFAKPLNKKIKIEES